MKDNYSWLDKAQKTADYLYSLDDSCPPELRQAIATLRQLTNEEFVHKDKTISSQLIWDILKEAFTKQIEIEKLRARIDQVMLDEVSLSVELDVDENELIDWRIATTNKLKLKELEK
jgi:ribonuclease I